MYLGLLTEKGKKIFLDLAVHFIWADGRFTGEERKHLDSCCRELQIEYVEADRLEPLDNLYEQLRNNTTEKEKRIILFELIAVALADKKYHSNEIFLTEELLRCTGLNDEYAKECKKILLQDSGDVQEKANQLIFTQWECDI